MRSQRGFGIEGQWLQTPITACGTFLLLIQKEDITATIKEYSIHNIAKIMKCSDKIFQKVKKLMQLVF